MCGIVGFSGEGDSYALKRMTDSIYHRGPDDEGFLETGHFSLGFRRLAIIDLTPNIYPVKNEDEDIFVFLNGEIYNYQDIKSELINRGHKFSTESDTEVIAHGYEEWGEEVLNYLRGMFAFMLYDKKKDHIFIARDRLGIKPLYYAEFNNRIVFASEIKALFAGFEIDREPDKEVVLKFLLARVHDDTKSTFFKNVKRLLPGHFMIIDNQNNFRIQKYWEPTYNKDFSISKPAQEYIDEFRDIFTEAMNLHLIADVPVGVTLSGGLDSSGITALAAKLYSESNNEHINANKQKMYSFSAIHPGETINEEEYIDSVVEATNVEPIKIQPEIDKFWDDLDIWTYFQEEPVISGAPYAYYTVMREARKYVTVLLSGQGGDELLAGYLPYFMTYLQSAFSSNKYFTAIKEIFAGKDLYWKYFFDKIGKQFSKGNYLDPNFMIIKGENEVNYNFSNYKNLNERLFKDVTSLTTPSLLRYEDKNSMANSLESRVPFFDHLVVEYIFNLPIEMKLKNGWTRYIYREAMKGIIPEKNRLRRSKIGFTNPEWEWIERKKENFLGVFDSQSFRSREFWDADKVIHEFLNTLDGKRKGDLLIFWRLFSVEMWLRKYVDNFQVMDTSKLVYFRS